MTHTLTLAAAGDSMYAGSAFKKQNTHTSVRKPDPIVPPQTHNLTTYKTHTGIRSTAQTHHQAADADNKPIDP